MSKTREERDGTLYCNSCNNWIPLEKFKDRGGRQTGQKHTMCNRCLYIKYTRPEAEKKLIVIREYKLESGCLDCGYNKHPAALEFDHRVNEAKLFNIGEKVGAYSLDKIWAEIAKCDVVCANCHAIRTEERRQKIAI